MPLNKLRFFTFQKRKERQWLHRIKTFSFREQVLRGRPWLARYGFTPTVVERSRGIRAGGYPIDVRNEAVEIAQRMGIWTRLQQEITTLDKLSFVDAQNQRISGFNILALREKLDLDSTWAEVMRGDLAETLYETTKDGIEYIFDDSILSLAQDENGVDVTFASGSTRRFDLVYARLVTSQVQPGTEDDVVQVFRDSVVPDAKQQPGFQGAMALVDRGANKTISIKLWQTEAEAKRSATSGYLQAQINKFASHLAAPPVVETFEVPVQE